MGQIIKQSPKPGTFSSFIAGIIIQYKNLFVVSMGGALHNLMDKRIKTIVFNRKSRGFAMVFLQNLAV